MPIKRMLEGKSFDSKTAATLVEAFNGVVADLDLRTVAERERGARTVIGLAASQSVLDVEKLRDEVADLMRNELALSVK